MQSFLDTDHYTFTCGQFVSIFYPDTYVQYDFIDRNSTTLNNPDKFLKKFEDRVNQVCDITCSEEEARYLSLNHEYLDSTYVNFLQRYRFNKNLLNYKIVDGKFYLTVNGWWFDTIFWEIPLLGIITDLYLEDMNASSNLDNHLDKILSYKDSLNGLDFCEFGTRRRRNFDYQDKTMEILKDYPGFSGTSNTHLARKYNVSAIGTQSHQIFMGASAYTQLDKVNDVVLNQWEALYPDNLKVALTDTYGTNAFLNNFNERLTKHFGVRQDSGEPIKFAQKFSKHYKKYGIENPQFYFSDSLTPEYCMYIQSEIKNLNSKNKYCMGTVFTNDQKLNLVMKLTKVNHTVDVIKLSDDYTKATGNKETINRAINQLRIGEI